MFYLDWWNRQFRTIFERGADWADRVVRGSEKRNRRRWAWMWPTRVKTTEGLKLAGRAPFLWSPASAPARTTPLWVRHTIPAEWKDSIELPSVAETEWTAVSTGPAAARSTRTQKSRPPGCWNSIPQWQQVASRRWARWVAVRPLSAEELLP